MTLKPGFTPIASLLLITTFAVVGAFAQPRSAQAQSAAAAGVKEEIKDISADVKKKKAELEALQKKEDRFRAEINKKKAESASLEDEIGLIENRIAKSQLDIEIAQQEIRSLELEMSLVTANIKSQEERIVRERVILGNLARKLYRAEFGKSTFELLLSHSSVSEYFDDLRAVTELQSGVHRALGRVQETKVSLESERGTQEAKRLAVEDRKRGIEVSKREMEDKRHLKDSLLIETKSSELEYRYLLAELKQEQSEADNEIQYLEKSLREKIDVADRLKGSDSILSWPYVPAKGISTRFHDPEYPFRYVFEHPGLDIRGAQGTAVRASAAGIVARAKNGGMEYSYVMLIHNGEISTVYGHLSKITVKEDTFVERGEVIGYSGGMPGTPGAGRMTTGPHLHFETRLRGIPVDPMRFLVAF